MLFQGDGIEVTRSRVTLDFGTNEFVARKRCPLEPAQPLGPLLIGNRSGSQIFPQRIDYPHALPVGELPREPETVFARLEAGGLVGSARKRKFRFWTRPLLIFKFGRS